jgi:hypothetical protein
MYNVNCSIFYSAFLKRDWIKTEDKVGLLEWKCRFDLVSYAARGSPDLHIDDILNYKPKRLAMSWEQFFKRANDFEDDAHLTKFLRVLANGQQVCAPYDGSDPKRSPMGSNMWLQVAYIAMDSVEREAVPRARWSGALTSPMGDLSGPICDCKMGTPKGESLVCYLNLESSQEILCFLVVPIRSLAL